VSLATIVWTQIDEAPALATLSLLPIVQAFTKGTGVSVETRDISLAGRIIATFPESLTEAQRIPDFLGQLGDLTHKARGQHHQAAKRLGLDPPAQGSIKELQSQGYRLHRLPRDSRKTMPRRRFRRGTRRCSGSGGQPGAPPRATRTAARRCR